MFQLFRNTMRTHFPTGSRRQDRYGGSQAYWGDFLFVMRTIMIRHSIKQKELPSRRDLMSLPGKEEKEITIEFSEKREKSMKN